MEHIGVVSQLLKEAKRNRGDIAIVWLDLKNAYGSIPHKLVEAALHRHYVPSKITELISDYYNNFQLRTLSENTASAWHKLEKGIITGCTISATLFCLAMNMLIKTAETECKGPVTRSGLRQPPIRAYMDDMTITTTSVMAARWLLKRIEKHITWARMSFNPVKSRSLVLRKGNVLDKERFRLSGGDIPTIREKPVKSLGKRIDHSLKYTTPIQETKDKLETWLIRVDKSGLPGRFKAWIYQHAILPKILWPLSIYEFTTSHIEQLEKRINMRLRRWLGLPKSLTSAALYGNTNALQLPLVEEFKVTKIRTIMQYELSKDPKVAGAGIEIHPGRKWRVENELRVAKERLREKAILGAVATGRTGLEFFPTIRVDRAKDKEKNLLIQEEVRKGEEEKRVAKMVALRQQGAWTNWESIIYRKIK